MNVLFLDIDGVLVSRQSMAREIPLHPLFEEEHFALDAVNILLELIHDFHFNVVLSSSWRLFQIDYDIIEKLLLQYKIEIFDITPDFNVYSFTEKQRADEIIHWLNEHPEVEQFVILDDEPFTKLSSNHIKTTWEKGLQPFHKEMVKTIMEK